MSLPVDLLASLALGAFCASALVAFRFAGSARGYDRVAQQGGTIFLGLPVMNAGYWLLQPVVRLCVHTGTSPAMLSWLSLGPAALAGFAAATGYWGAAAWCLFASALLDVLDGAVARAAHRASPAGAVLDSVLDRYAEFFFFAGVLAYYRHMLAVQLLVLAALFGSFLITYSTARAEALRLTPPRGSMKRSDRIALLVAGTALAPFSQRWLETAGGVPAWPVLGAVGLIAVLANLSALARFAALSRSAQS
jgi:CDP-diacylglycerol--glycerol-3-phosphate 3-phosphatidyltransferase